MAFIALQRITSLGAVVGGGGGFTLGPAQNVFTGADRTAAEAARDLYDTNNPGWIADYDADTSLNIRLEFADGGDQVVLFQVTDGASTWLDNSSATGVQGDTGAAGATGNSYFFASIAARDTFFGTPPNEGLLETDLPVIVNIGNDTESTFVWGGATAPVSYDATLWRLSSKEVSSGSLFLGQGGATVSSGNDVLNFASAAAGKHFIHGVLYDDAGAEHPHTWILDPKATVILADVFDTDLADPQSTTFTTTLNSYVGEYTLIPATAGTLRVETFLGSDDTGPVIVDTSNTVLIGDIGVETLFQVPNDTLVLVGQQTFTRYSGIQLKGGVQTSGAFIGLTTPFIKVNVWNAVSKDYVLSGALTDKFVVVGDGGANVRIASPDNIAGVRINTAGEDAVVIRPQTGMLASYNIEDDTGTTKLQVSYADSTDTSSILLTGGANNAVVSEGSDFHISSNGGTLHLLALTDIIIDPVGETLLHNVAPYVMRDKSLQSTGTTTNNLTHRFENAEFVDSFDLSNEMTNPILGMWVKPSGDRVYTCENDGGSIFTYDLNTPWAVSAFVYTGETFNSAQSVGSLLVNKDETRYITISGTNVARAYDMGTPGDLTTSVLDQTVTLSDVVGTSLSAFLSADELTLLVGDDDGIVYQFEFGAPFDLTSLSFTTNTLDVGSTSAAQAIFVKPNMTELYSHQMNSVKTFTLKDPSDISTGVLSSTAALADSNLDRCFAISPAGDVQFAASTDTVNNVTQRSLGTTTRGLTIPIPDGDTNGIRFKTDSLEPAAFMQWEDANQILRIDGEGDGTGEVHIHGNAVHAVVDNNNVVIQQDNGSDAIPMLRLINTGTNGGNNALHVGDRNPLDLVSTNPGDWYWRDSGTESGMYVNKGTTTPNTDGWITTSLLAKNEIDIFTAADLDALASGGVITISTATTLRLKADITTSNRFVMADASLQIVGDLPTVNLVYTGTGNMFSGDGSLELFRFSLISVSTGSFMAMSQGAGLKIVFIAGVPLIGWDDLGSIIGGALTLDKVATIDWGAGFSLEGLGLISTSTFGSPQGDPASGTLLSIGGRVAGTYRIDSGASTFTNGSSLLRLDPGLPDAVKINVASNAILGNLFETTGTTGTFTVVADDPVSIGIDSVQDDGGGLARFNEALSASDIFVGEIVTISGYVTNTDYNGEFVVIATPAADAFVVNVAFGTDEASGTVDAEVITLTDTATTLFDGATLVISTDNTIEYDGGATVFNQLTNTVQINRSYNLSGLDPQTGTWDTSGIDHTDVRVIASVNPGFPESTVKAEIAVSGNVTTTNVPAAGAKVMINATGWVTSSQERIKTDAEGDAIITSSERVSAILDGNVLLEPASSTKNISCQFVRQDFARQPCTFDSIQNTVLSTAHGLAVNDKITFHDTAGTLDTAVREDIIYFVESIVDVNEFSIGYTAGGAGIGLLGGSSGSNSFALADLHGSKPANPIAANSPRTLVPQALEDAERGDKTFIIVSNEDDGTDIEVIDAYYRIVV